MTLSDKDKQTIRENTSMKLFNLYLDDVTKLDVLQKLKKTGLDTQKGALSALIRVLLRHFAELPLGDPAMTELIAEVQKEYIFTTKKNKRSKL